MVGLTLRERQQEGKRPVLRCRMGFSLSPSRKISMGMPGRSGRDTAGSVPSQILFGPSAFLLSPLDDGSLGFLPGGKVLVASPSSVQTRGLPSSTLTHETVKWLLDPGRSFTAIFISPYIFIFTLSLMPFTTSSHSWLKRTPELHSRVRMKFRTG